MASATSGAATVEREALRREQIFGAIQRRGALVVLIAVVIVAALTLDAFFTAANIENILLHASFLGLIAVGMTFVIITGGVDLSVGSLAALGGVLAGLSVGAGWPLALIVPTLACGIIGLVNGLLIAKARLPFLSSPSPACSASGAWRWRSPGRRPSPLAAPPRSPGSGRARSLVSMSPS
jgi:predicted ABC-type sugar transport system permease subunit